jgi:hypothetical protein
MFIYVHQGRFSSTRTDCVNSSVYFLSARRWTRIVQHIEWWKGWYCISSKEWTRFSTVINEYQLATLYINDFRQWSAFHIGIQLKRFAWLSINDFIRLITSNLYVWQRFRYPMSESLLLFNVIPLRFFYQCNPLTSRSA